MRPLIPGLLCPIGYVDSLFVLRLLVAHKASVIIGNVAFARRADHLLNVDGCLVTLLLLNRRQKGDLISLEIALHFSLGQSVFRTDRHCASAPL